MSAVIEVDNLVKRYPGADADALSGIRLTVQSGCLFGLIGADGAGKSTLLKILSTLVTPDSGGATVLGADVRTGMRRIRTSIGYMPQRFSLYHDLTVLENLSFFADVFGVQGVERERRLKRLLAFARLEPFVHRRAGRLSGGMKQKLALCCALVHSPPLCILDEPTTGVDPVSRNEFWEILQELVAGGVTILVSTPYMDETRYCGTVAMIHEGRLLCEGTPAHLLEMYPHDVYRMEAGGGEQAALRDRAAHPPFVRATYASGSELKVVVERGTEREKVRRWVREKGMGLGEPRLAPPVMEDVFIERAGKG